MPQVQMKPLLNRTNNYIIKRLAFSRANYIKPIIYHSLSRSLLFFFFTASIIFPPTSAATAPTGPAIAAPAITPIIFLFCFLLQSSIRSSKPISISAKPSKLVILYLVFNWEFKCVNKQATRKKYRTGFGFFLLLKILKTAF